MPPRPARQRAGIAADQLSQQVVIIKKLTAPLFYDFGITLKLFYSYSTLSKEKVKIVGHFAH
jgi:hypothetical protein